jgi:hypothetical protein
MHSQGDLFSWRTARLKAAIVDAEARLQWAKAAGRDAVRTRLCDELLEQARVAVKSTRLWNGDSREFFAWDCIAQFDRQMLHLVDEQDLRPIWLSLLAEAQEKCSGHRKQAVAEIARQVDNGGLTRSAVETVLQHLQTTSQNQYYKIGRLKQQIIWAGWVLLILILLVLYWASRGLFEVYGPGLGSQVALGTLLGWVGGVLSVALSVTSADEKAKIPKLVSSFRVSLVRPLIGAALALPVILVVNSGLIQIGGVDQKWVAAIACLLAGFSERWFLGVMTGLEQRVAVTPGKEAHRGP